MTATFLVEVEIPDPSPNTLLLLSDDIDDALESGGVPVVSVKPWQREGLIPQPTIQSAPPLFQPPSGPLPD